MSATGLRLCERSAPGSWDLDGVIERELALGSIRPFIVAGIANTNDRLDEYTHVTDDRGTGVIGGNGDADADFVVQDVLPLIANNYRTSTSASDRGVLGSSLGGLNYYHIADRHPTQIGFVAGLSSTFSWGSIGLSNPTMQQRLDSDPNLAARGHVYYLDSGGGPGAGCPAGSSDNYCSTVDMRDMLVRRTILPFPDNPDVFPLTPANIRIMHWWEANAPHNEAAWNARVHRALRLFARP